MALMVDSWKNFAENLEFAYLFCEPSGQFDRGCREVQQIQELIKIILNTDEIEKRDDVADGIALAIVHLNSYKTYLLIDY